MRKSSRSSSLFLFLPAIEDGKMRLGVSWGSWVKSRTSTLVGRAGVWRTILVERAALWEAGVWELYATSRCLSGDRDAACFVGDMDGPALSLAMLALVLSRGGGDSDSDSGSGGSDASLRITGRVLRWFEIGRGRVEGRSTCPAGSCDCCGCERGTAGNEGECFGMQGFSLSNHRRFSVRLFLVIEHHYALSPSGY